MIARVWTAGTSGPETAEQYRQLFEAEVLDRLRGLDGFHGAFLLARRSGESTETQLKAVTLFESLDAVRIFAGDDYERERVTPAARATLTGSDPAVLHYTVLTNARGL